MRTILYMAAASASRWNPPLKALYHRLLERGKPKKLALIAVARKLLTLDRESNTPQEQAPLHFS